MSNPPRSRRFDLIAFDWDGTLYDSTQIIVRCIQSAVVDVGGQKPTDEQAAYVIGMALMPALAYAAPDVPKEKYPMSLFDGILPMLQALREKQHLLTVATGKSRQGLDDALHQVALRGMFDGSRTADETAGKPNPRMLHELMAEFGVSPERTLMIGDTTHDLEMAHNAGCASIAVSYGAHGTSDFGRWNPLTVAHNVGELHDWLIGHG